MLELDEIYKNAWSLLESTASDEEYADLMSDEIFKYFLERIESIYRGNFIYVYFYSRLNALNNVCNGLASLGQKKNVRSLGYNYFTDASILYLIEMIIYKYQ